MAQRIDLSLLDGHELYHLRYGRGAVIVAVRRDPDETTAAETSKQDKYLASLYNARGPGNSGTVPEFEPVLSLEEEAGFLRVTVQFKRMSRLKSQYPDATATIERVIPVDQVTLEIVRASDRPPIPQERRFR